MNLQGQHTAKLFTVLAGLIILAHVVVPHHHHYDLTHYPEQESTRAKTGKKHSSENPDSHCHAFNLLISEKTSPSTINQSFLNNLNLYTAGIIDNIELPPVKNITTIIPGPQANFLKQGLFSAHALRGPPVES